MKTNKLIRIGVIIVFSLLILSCTKVNPAFNRENIVGSWVFDTKDGVVIPEKEYIIYTFEKGIGATRLYWDGVINLGDGNNIWGQEQLLYEVKCSDLEIRGTISGFDNIVTAAFIQREYEIIEQKDSLLTIKPISFMSESSAVDPGYTQASMRKLSKSVALAGSIVGTWEVISIGSENINTFRLEFLEGEILYFYLKQPNGAWLLQDVIPENYYNTYPKIVVLTLNDNDLLGKADKWDVAFFNVVSLSTLSKEMILSKDGVEYTFTMVEASQEEK